MAPLREVYDLDPVGFLSRAQRVLQMQQELLGAIWGNSSVQEHQARAKAHALVRALSLQRPGHEDQEAYPFEPMLDEDFLYDANNWLEDFVVAAAEHEAAVAREKAAAPQHEEATAREDAEAAHHVDQEEAEAAREDREDRGEAEAALAAEERQDEQRQREAPDALTLLSMGHARDPAPETAEELLPGLSEPAEAGEQTTATTTRYPYEALLDQDFVWDAGNYLEDLARKVMEERRGARASGAATTTRPAEAAAEPQASALLPAPLPPAAASTDAVRQQGGHGVQLSANCMTRASPRHLSAPELHRLGRHAAEGTPCLFGQEAQDEGYHCIRGQDYGFFGWCFTRPNKGEWGFCSSRCPLGKADVAGLVKSSVALEGLVTEMLNKARNAVPEDARQGPLLQAEN